MNLNNFSNFLIPYRSILCCSSTDENINWNTNQRAITLQEHNFQYTKIKLWRTTRIHDHTSERLYAFTRNTALNARPFCKIIRASHQNSKPWKSFEEALEFEQNLTSKAWLTASSDQCGSKYLGLPNPESFLRLLSSNKGPRNGTEPELLTPNDCGTEEETSPHPVHPSQSALIGMSGRELKTISDTFSALLASSPSARSL